MSRPMKSSLVALPMIIVSVVLLQYNSGNASQLARAAETQIPTQVQAPGDATHDQLRKLLLERKEILDRLADDMEVRLKHGRGSITEYGQAKKAALLAGIDLCNSRSERIEIHKKIVKLYVELEKSGKRRAEAGVGQGGLDLIRVARLEAEIALLREQLK